MEMSVKVSAGKKKTVLTRYYLLAQLCEQYTADRRSLLELKRLVRREFKRCKENAYYPLSDSDMRDIGYFIAELKEIVAGLLKRQDAERYSVAISRLYALLDRMHITLKATEELLNENHTLESAIETAKNIRDLVGQGVRELKKTFGGVGSK